MNLLTCVDKEIAQQDGEDVLDNQTIVVYLSGYSVMEKMIVETTAMSFQKIAQHAKLSLILSARITVVYLNNGLGNFSKHFTGFLYNNIKFLVISLMTVEMDLMKQKAYAKENIVNVQNQNSVVTTTSVFQADGDAVILS